MKTNSSSSVETALSGWGRYPVVTSYLQRPEKIYSLVDLIKNSSRETLLARGAGLSYGDAALNHDGQTILTERLNRMLSFNPRTGVLNCEAGVTIKEILEVFVPQGWFPFVSPGTKFVTVGGAVAFDVHGKNHHRDSSFCHHVQSLKLLLASGEIVLCSRQENPEIFWATVGGMGLTGFILEIELRLQPIETSYIQAFNIKAKNLNEAIALFEKYEPNYQYSVAWIDCLASGKALGRSILMFGNHAKIADLNTKQQSSPINIPSASHFTVPFDAPAGLLNYLTMKIFNNIYYTKQIRNEMHKTVNYDTFFYPLDFLKDWNRLYGKKGFIQYQFVIPLENSYKALTEILELCAKNGKGSFLAVLKRLGSQDGLLSFSMPGYTLALDIPIKPGLWDFLEKLDEVVIQYGGRVYLAKDARLSPESFRKMYLNFPQWLKIKSKLDPNNYFSSEMSKRLDIKASVESI